MATPAESSRTSSPASSPRAVKRGAAPSASPSPRMAPSISPTTEPNPSGASATSENSQTLLLRSGRRSGRQVGIVGIHDTLPLPVRLLLPDLDQLAGIAHGSAALRIPNLQRVGPVKISQLP